MFRKIDMAGQNKCPQQPCFIIAEAGVNHNGKLDMAHKLIDVAVQAGADAVKFQTFKAAKMISPLAPKANYQLRTTGNKESQLEMIKRLELPYNKFRELYDHCQEKDILFMSTPFDEESAEFLDDLGVEVFKISSGEITNLPLLSYVAGFGRPMIVSTGMANLGEVETAVQTIEATGNDNLVLLHCVSNYPADPKDSNLRAIKTLEKSFNRSIGYSDHTPGIEVALAAVAMGACVIEKHFTLDRNLSGPDHIASLNPHDLKLLVRGIRIVESAMGDGRKIPVPSEANTADVARKSLVAAYDIPAGAVLKNEMINVMRPGTGLPPQMTNYIIGRKLRQSVNAGTLFELEMLM